jgi:amino acid transporter
VAVVPTGSVVKRILLGRKMSSDRLHETLLPKRLALPIFASDALSSNAYAPDEILLTLAMAGGAFMATNSMAITLAVVGVMLVVVASYRQNVHAYPSGGGDYEVATVNLGPKAGLGVASALLVDYVLTVAVSISSGAQYAATALPALRGHEVELAVALVVLLTAMNLRGVRESGKAFAIPVYTFMASVLGMGLFGLFKVVTGTLGQAPSAAFELKPEEGMESLAGMAMVFLLLRAFSSGCAALTGVEAISNGVPAFEKPKSKNAATTLLLMGLLSVTMLSLNVFLASKAGVKYAHSPAEQLLDHGVPVGDSYVQDPVLGQVARVVFGGFGVGVILISVVTGLILVLAANTAFNGFPVLGSILAKDGFLPRQLHTRGDRLAYSNGIIILAAAALGLIVAYQAKVTELINLYIVGVFVSFTLSQIGMIRHWNRNLALTDDPSEKRAMRISRVINTIGAAMSALVLVVVLGTKFNLGAKWALLGMAFLFVLMLGIRRHYDTVSKELALDEDHRQLLPSRVHAVVLVSRVHKPALRALAYARASRPTTLEALTVAVDADDANRLAAEWNRLEIPVPLKILDSPYREITRPVVEYIQSIRTGNPRDVVTVYIPEYVVGRWYEQVLHNQSALRLKARLLFTPGVMMVSVPWQLKSSEGQDPEWVDGHVGTRRITT